MERYNEALLDHSSGLTHTSLAGLRKQSVQDAERMFSTQLADFMKRKGYTFEEKYVRVVCNWRRANDERGLSELERSHFNYDFLNFILDELMPWHTDNYDFSTLEVNMYVISKYVATIKQLVTQYQHVVCLSL